MAGKMLEESKRLGALGNAEAPKRTLGVAEYRGVRCDEWELLGGWLGLFPANQRPVCCFFGAATARACVFFNHGGWLFTRAPRRAFERGALPAPRTRQLAGFVVNEVRRDDIAARFAGAPDAVAKR